ncbi:MAG: hypothetical protein ACRDF6_00110 [bacterium]
MDERKALEQVREALVGAVDSRRELVAYSRLEAIEMDRQARDVERRALTTIRGLIPGIAGNADLQQVKTRLVRMDQQLEELTARTDIQERSRMLEQDDITWKTFEDIAWLLGVG